MPQPKWKVLMIGGGTGAGKSTLAYELGKRFDVAVLDGDDLRYAIESAVPPGTDPALHIFRSGEIWRLPVVC